MLRVLQINARAIKEVRLSPRVGPTTVRIGVLDTGISTLATRGIDDLGFIATQLEKIRML